MAHRIRFPLRFALAACALAVLPACRTASADAPPAAQKVFTVRGLGFPESVKYDPDQDAYLISNMAGPGSLHDGHGYIVRAAAADPRKMDVLVQGGRGGAELHAPKGMAIRGDTLWVADIDALRGFHRRTGAPLATVDLRGQAVMLNDVAAGPDGTLRVTDTGIKMTRKGVLYTGGDRIFAVGPGGAARAVAEGRQLGRPNGITWDPDGRRWIVVSFDPFNSEVYALRPGQAERTVLGRGKGRFDGVERLADGRILVTSWSDSSLHVFEGGRSRRVVRGLWQPADLGVDTRRGLVAIPLALQGRVELWRLPPAGRGGG